MLLSYPPNVIKGVALETVRQYTVGILDEKMTFDANTNYICKKASQGLFFFRKLWNFHVDSSLMKFFYSSFIESILTFLMISFLGGNFSMTNKNRLEGVKACQKIISINFNSLCHVDSVRATQKAKAIQTATS